MPISTKWLVPHVILYNTFSDQVTLSEFAEMNRRNYEMITELNLSHDLYILFNVTPGVTYNRDFFNINTMKLAVQIPPKVVLSLVIDSTPNPAASFVGKLLLKLFGVEYQACRTHTEALQWLRRRYPDLVLPETLEDV